MTMIRVDLVGVELTRDQKADCTDRLTEAWATVEVGEDSALARTGFMVIYEHFKAEDVWVGTAPLVDAGPSGKAAVVTANVMSGPWTDAMKAELFAATETIVRDVAEIERADSGWDFWMTITEVPDGGWSLGGRPVSIRDIAGIFTEDRQQRIAKYLAPDLERRFAKVSSSSPESMNRKVILHDPDVSLSESELTVGQSDPLATLPTRARVRT
jgi:phenylpyruvate tautomerase PptA (4-oxalocrotonate tautomerase family)